MSFLGQAVKGMWDPSSATRDPMHPLHWEQSPNHWTPGKSQGLTSNKYNMENSQCVSRLYEAWKLSSLSHIIHSGGSYLPYCKDTQAICGLAHMVRNQASYQQPRERTIFKSDSPASGKPSDEHGLSQHQTPITQKTTSPKHPAKVASNLLTHGNREPYIKCL